MGLPVPVSLLSMDKCLSCSIQNKLGSDGSTLLKESNSTSVDTHITALGMQLDAMAKLLQLHPSNKHGKVKHKLKPVSYKAIEGVHIVCPNSFQCTTHSCNPHSLQQVTRLHDIPLVTLIKGFNIYEDCPVLAGKYTQCDTTYYADHERAPMEDRERKYSQVYLNTANISKLAKIYGWTGCFLMQL
jgi:CxC5 like cysteine cluster associated with KDZ transposases